MNSISNAVMILAEENDPFGRGETSIVGNKTWRCEDCGIQYTNYRDECLKCGAKRPAEMDPNGIDQHTPGAKLDDGKVDLTYLQDWPLALAAVCQVAEYGAKKYTRGGWKHVPNGFARYTAALFRHLFGLANDDGLDHDAQVAWNALSRLELKLQAQKK